jgi:misacylated tRNA(Ala) deacylase
MRTARGVSTLIIIDILRSARNGIRLYPAIGFAPECRRWTLPGVGATRAWRGGYHHAMTDELFRSDAYLRDCEARILRVEESGIVLDRTVFYPQGGGQAGDSGRLLLADGREIAIADTRKAKDAEGQATAEIIHVPAPGQEALLDALKAGDGVTARIDWERRHRLMRFHTATHLLCHLVPQPVNGCSITPEYARLDFHMTEPLDKEALSAGLAQLVAAGHPLTVGAITEAELDANPALVKSMSVQPPRGTGTVRTIRIGEAELIDFQPCGGTHVANTREIGAVVVTKIEKKSANSRRVVLGWAA